MGNHALRGIRTVFMGTPAFAVPSLRSLHAAGATIAGVVTQPDRPSGRGHRLHESAIAAEAQRLHLPVSKPDGFKRDENHAALQALRPDLLVVVAYGHILPKAVLDLPRLGAVNVHASLLPKYRGPAPVPAAILTGDTETGVTIMKLDEGIDTGPILSQERESILPDDTTATLSARLADRGARLLIPTLEAYLAGALTPTPQDGAQASRAPLLAKEDGRIEWTMPAERIERMIRAFTPWPRAYTQWNGKQLTIHRTSVEAAPPSQPPGTVLPWRGTFGVVTGNGLLRVEELQLEGRARLTAEAFLQGNRSILGSLLTP